MDLFQWKLNPWGQEILVRISWDLLWIAVAAGALFILGHLMFRRWSAKHAPVAAARQADPDLTRKVPERVVRHPLASRLFHWVMAASMLVLLFTGFLPVLGIQFSWVTLHWIAGLVLIGTVIFHIVHASVWLNLEDIWIGRRDLGEWWIEVKRNLGRPDPPPPKPGKYAMESKFFHHLVLLATFAVLGTGLLMMVRIETPFWARNPYLLSESAWGWVYVLHGLSSVGLVAMVMAHVYFAILPEKRWLTVSMIAGWITRQDYLANHDLRRWDVSGEAPAAPAQARKARRLEHEPT
jgi:cytochrome b subunit of formate dehydrogenase